MDMHGGFIKVITYFVLRSLLDDALHFADIFWLLLLLQKSLK